MKATTISVLAALSGFLGPGIAAAYAEDFTITVPVSVRNLPAEARPQVTCRAIVDNDANIIGIGTTDLPNGSADYSGTVTVGFDLYESDASDGVVPADATGYVCSLLLHPDADHIALSWDRCQEVGREPRNNPLICGARDEAIVGRVTGTF